LIKRFFVVAILFLLLACGRNDTPIIAFYYWKTIFKLSEIEKATLKDNNVTKLYIRYFDIGLNPKTGESIPLSPIHFQENVNVFAIVPVVFIKNKVMLQAV